MTTEEQQQLALIRHHLLVWAGYHRGTALLEEGMPRFHELIDAMSALIPEMIIIQGGTCWACGEEGMDLTWWHVAVYDERGKMVRNQRTSFLIHKNNQCTRLAEEKVQA